jgi:HTH-type transcriptional regulator, sugar sensing transcriptional regulator
MNLELLKEIGMTTGEIKTYFALLELGSTTTGPLSKKAEIHSSKIYPVLDKLIKKGLASYIIQNNTRYYQASNPDKLLNHINQRKKNLEEQEEKIKKIIPEIIEKQKYQGKKQTASIYEGIKGIKTIFEIMLNEWKEGDDYLAFTPGEEYTNEEINKFYKKHHLKRIEKGIKVKLIALEKQKNFYKKTYGKIKNFEFKFTKQSIPASINIVKNKVCTLIWHPTPTAYVIESEILANKYRQFFKEMWKTAKKELLFNTTKNNILLQRCTPRNKLVIRINLNIKPYALSQILSHQAF